MQKPFLTHSLSAHRISFNKEGTKVTRDAEPVTIYPGFYDAVGHGELAPKPGRTWIKHYDSKQYEVDAKELVASTELKESGGPWS